MIVSADGTGVVSQAGAVLLVQALRVTGLDRGLREALGRWRAPRAVHDPGKVVADLAAALALGGDCLLPCGVAGPRTDILLRPTDEIRRGDRRAWGGLDRNCRNSAAPSDARAISR